MPQLQHWDQTASHKWVHLVNQHRIVFYSSWKFYEAAVKKFETSE
jgi:hypothetical protein